MMEDIILASGSPRRKELLTLIGVPFRVVKSDAPEVITQTAPGKIVEELSEQKAHAVLMQLEDEDRGKTVLGADTIVVLDGEVLGKPKDREDAKRMLLHLQGKAHSVFTGVTLLRLKNGPSDSGAASHEAAGEGQIQKLSFFRETKVFVHAMSDAEIEAYLDTGDPFDKAGSYGIQGPFAAFVDGIEGDYQTVVGLPVAAVYQALKAFTAE